MIDSYFYVNQEGIAVDAFFNVPTQHILEHRDGALECIDITHITDVGVRYFAVDASDQTLPEGYAFVSVRKLLSSWTKDQLHPAFRAIQLIRWQKEHGFCSRCGATTQRHPTDFAMVCTACRYHQYPRVQPCVIVAITREVAGKSCILLAKDKRHTMGFFSLIAGFVEAGETLEHAIAREVKEETGLDVCNTQYLGSQPWPFPSNLMVAYTAEYAGGDIVLADDELEHAEFFPLDALPRIPPEGSIAYDMIQHVCTGEPLNL